ncbi:MAG TPA: methylmalonyl Co-A mutase-associated GTPase MeaB [Bacteroidetes bacterium]|nr:methylmalonyl Co-A mutase-associated GTPase MeaB [Bacteroidota bacterium]
MSSTAELISLVKNGDFKSLARVISLVENDTSESLNILEQLKINHSIPVVGITGPPGAGKSSLVNSILKKLSAEGKKIAVIAVDPTSPFNFGSLLGDRIRLSEHFNDENIFIRSIATRGALGGLSDKIIEVTDVLRSAPFDLVIIETVGVGQSEVEIAGLADTTIVVLVPEAGDEVQTMKAGLMEIADIFVVNKADRDGVDKFIQNISILVHEKEINGWQIPVVKTIATKNEGVDELIEKINLNQFSGAQNDRKIFLLTDKAYRLIAKQKMKNIKREDLFIKLKSVFFHPDFNLYKFSKEFLSQNQ